MEAVFRWNVISFQRNDKPRNTEGKPLDEISENVRSRKGKIN